MIGYKNSNNNRVADNTITGPKIRHGILLQYYAHHNLVENNTITGTVYDAIDLHGEDEYSNEMRLNTITGCGEGGFGVGNTGAGHANSGPNNWIHHNTVTGCKFGVHIYRKSNTQFVNDNEFSRNTQYGMLIEADGGAADVHFTHNKVLNNASTGVVLNKAPGVELVGNIVTGNKGAALITDTATTNYLITDNDFRKNAGGVKLPTTTGTFTDNTPNTYTK
jgi:parallel beta-helix repeat protein